MINSLYILFIKFIKSEEINSIKLIPSLIKLLYNFIYFLPSIYYL